jgi:hypothetical protein
MAQPVTSLNSSQQLLGTKVGRVTVHLAEVNQVVLSLSNQLNINFVFPNEIKEKQSHYRSGQALRFAGV